MIDVVIPLGSGSTWEDNELRYALRSVEQAIGSQVRNLYLLSDHIPTFLGKNAIWVPVYETHRMKEMNIYQKIMVACRIPDLSNDFLFMNDDHFICKSFCVPKMPFYYSCDILDVILKRGMNDVYTQAMNNTMKALESREHLTRYYDVHVPIIYNKNEFPLVMGLYDWKITPGYIIKSLYCNTINPVNSERIDDVLLKQGSEEAMIDATKTKFCFSFRGGQMIRPTTKRFLQWLYPNNSRWEMTTPVPYIPKPASVYKQSQH